MTTLLTLLSLLRSRPSSRGVAGRAHAPSGAERQVAGQATQLATVVIVDAACLLQVTDDIEKLDANQRQVHRVASHLLHLALAHDIAHDRLQKAILVEHRETHAEKVLFSNHAALSEEIVQGAMAHQCWALQGC